MLDFIDVAQDLRLRDQDTELVFKAEQTLRAAYANANLELRNVESLWSTFEMAQLLNQVPGLTAAELSRLDISLRRLIVQTLNRTLHCQNRNSDDAGMPVPYDKFRKLMHRVMYYTILTFNYDTAVDVGLAEDPGDYYRDDRGPQDRLLVPDQSRILKLHGSLHWARCSKADCLAITECGWSSPLEGLRVGSQLDRHRCAACGSPCSADPVIVPPTWYKAQAHKALGGVWKQAGIELSRARNVFVIGYSLPQSDRFFRDLFGLATIGAPLRRIWICDPNAAAVEARWRAFLGPGAVPYLRALSVPFSEAIAPIWECLSRDNQFD